MTKHILYTELSPWYERAVITYEDSILDTSYHLDNTHHNRSVVITVL